MGRPSALPYHRLDEVGEEAGIVLSRSIPRSYARLDEADEEAGHMHPRIVRSVWPHPMVDFADEEAGRMHRTPRGLHEPWSPHSPPPDVWGGDGGGAWKPHGTMVCDPSRLCDLLAIFAISALLLTIILSLAGALPAPPAAGGAPQTAALVPSTAPVGNVTLRAS